MKRKMKVSLMVTLSLLLSLVSLPATAKGQPPPARFVGDTGPVTPGMGQILRITVDGADGNDAIRVRIRWMQYGALGCSGMPPVCRHMVVAQGATPVETLAPDVALSVDVPGNGDAVRVVVESNSPNARVLCVVFDTSTQRIVATMQVIMANTEGDFH